MANADLIIGMNSDRLNQAIGKIFSNSGIRERLFSGSQRSSFNDVSFVGKWVIEAPPVLELRAPTGDEWNNSIKADGNEAIPREDAFITNLHKLNVALSTSDSNRQTVIPVQAICTVDADGKNFSLHAHAAIIDLSAASPMDQFFAKAVIIPQVLSAVNQTLKGIALPVPALPGVSLTSPEVSIQNNRLLISYNMVEHGQPAAPVSVPDLPFFILASQPVEQALVNYIVTSQIQGKRFSKNGSEGGGGFSAEYNANGRVDNIQVRTTNDPTMLSAEVSLSMNASAGINTPAGYIVKGGEIIYEGIKDAANQVAKVMNPSNW